MVAARGARVILVVEAPTLPLLSNLSGVSQCLPISAEMPGFDMHCPMSTLPLVFGTRLDTIPSDMSYLPPLPEARIRAWRAHLDDRVGPHDKLRVGLVWSGNPIHKNDHNRSTSLRMLSRILDVGAIFFSLQKDPRPEDQATLRERTEIVDLTAELTDFVETAALVSCLDVVITIDSSVAHPGCGARAPDLDPAALHARLPPGCSIARTAPGTRRRDYSVRPRPGTMAPCSIVSGTNSRC